MINGVKIGNESAIYSIVNTVNGKMYIGSAVNLRNRRRIHISQLRNNKHHSVLLQRAFDKYKEENFSFELIEYVTDKNNLIKREQVWIDFFKPEYNICKIANSKLGVSPSEETREKISDFQIGKKRKPHTEESKKLMSDKKKGRVFSEEHKKNLSDVKKGISPPHNFVKWSTDRKKKRSIEFKGRVVSEDWKRNMSIAKLGDKSIFSKLVLNLENGIYYDSIIESCNSYSRYDLTQFKNRLQGRRKNNTPFIFLD